jgi:hypothetical protein
MCLRLPTPLPTAGVRAEPDLRLCNTRRANLVSWDRSESSLVWIGHDSGALLRFWWCALSGANGAVGHGPIGQRSDSDT